MGLQRRPAIANVYSEEISKKFPVLLELSTFSLFEVKQRCTRLVAVFPEMPFLKPALKSHLIFIIYIYRHKPVCKQHSFKIRNQSKPLRYTKDAIYNVKQTNHFHQKKHKKILPPVGFEPGMLG